MKSKLVLGILLTLLFIGVLAFAFRVKPVKAWTGGTITILEGGGVTPAGAPLSSIDLITYTLDEDVVCTESIGIAVERDDIIIDGAGYTLQGAGGGIDLYRRTNVTIKNMEIKDCGGGVMVNNSSDVTISRNNITDNGAYGVVIANSSRYNTIIGNNISATLNCSIYIYWNSEHNRVSGNNITNNIEGVLITRSTHNVVSGNKIKDNYWGVHFSLSYFNYVYENNITNNDYGVGLLNSGYNVFCYNNFIDNTQQVNSDLAYINFWNGSYPHRGNYWNEQTHFGAWADRFYGPCQDIAGSDGILDNDPYEIDVLNIDHLPLTHQWTPTKTSIVKGVHAVQVCIDSNTTISDIGASGPYALTFTASATGAKGYVFIIIEDDSQSQPRVQINGADPPTDPTAVTNGTHWFIYFEFPLSTHTITITFWPTVGGTYIPANKLSLLAPYIALASTILAATAATTIYVKRRKKKQ